MSEKILFVDDDENILRGFTRRLQGQFELETATSGLQGLSMVVNQGPYAVVVADMRMPQMDGIDFLGRVKVYAPHTVRIMLTGNADMRTAVDAVNRGNIFRFLTKPCPIDALSHSLEAALEQYRLVMAERELLEKTLSGTIKLLVELLGLTMPEAFSRTNRVAHLVGKMATALELPDVWQYKVATMFSQIGCITLPPEILQKVNRQEPLTDQELEMFAGHPAVGQQLLAHIPRLETVAAMIEKHQQPTNLSLSPQSLSSDQDKITLGAQLINLALDFDQHLTMRGSSRAALAAVQAQATRYNTHLLTLLETVTEPDPNPEAKNITLWIRVRDLEVGMILDQDVMSASGGFLVQADQEVTLSVLIRLRNFAKGVGVREPFRVRLPVVEEPVPAE